MDYLDALDHLLAELAESKRLLTPAEYALLVLLLVQHLLTESLEKQT